MTDRFRILDSGLVAFPYHDTVVKPRYGDLVDCPGQTMGRNYNLALKVLRSGLFSRLNFEMLSASLATLLSSLAHRLALKPHMALLGKPRDIQRRLGPFAIGSLRDMLVLWPVISWLNQEMPIIVNRSWGPQSSCRLHRLSYTSIVYRTHSHASRHARSMACYFLVKPRNAYHR